MKRCPRCGAEKEASLFYRNRAQSDGLSSWCIDCFQPVLRSARSRYRVLARNAKVRGIPVSITQEQYSGLISQPCRYCGFDHSCEGGGGLDRVDNAKGYHIDNVVSCCAVCNRAKSDFFSYEAMLVVGEAI